MPSLRECTIDIPPWEIATSPTLVKALKSFPDLRNIQFKCSIACLSEASQDRLKATHNLITDMEACGVRATIDIDAFSIRPADPLVESDFEEWLPWYPYLREHVVKLDLTFDALQPDDEFPPDLAPHRYLDFPLLESLSLDIRQTKHKFVQASKICSKIRAPRLRHLEVNVLESNRLEAKGEPLLHAGLAMVPEQTSLATFRFNAPEKCLVGLNNSWETMCQKLDIACAHEHWV